MSPQGQVAEAGRSSRLRVGTVYVVDDESSSRDSTARLLESVGYQVHRFADATHFLQATISESPACAVLDLRMPRMNGFEAFDRLRERRPDLPVLFLTGYGDVPSAVEAMRRGAFDFLEKPLRPPHLLDRVAKALAGCSQYRDRAKRRAEVQARVDSLTPRELQVLGMVTEGKTSREIALSLSISIKTVEVHRAHIMEKMRAHNLVDLVRQVIGSDPVFGRG